MVLQDLLGVIEDSQVVIISDMENNEIARYDGRESIPERLNDTYINTVYATDNAIRISIQLIRG